jgi:hypothetical protein
MGNGLGPRALDLHLRVLRARLRATGRQLGESAVTAPVMPGNVRFSGGENVLLAATF